MSKYKAGDKIKVVSSERKSYWYSDKIGQEFTLLGVDKTHGPFIKESQYYGRSFFSECDIEPVCANKQLVQEKEMKSEAFNLKANPWFIRVNNKEEFEAVKEWVISQGIPFEDFGCALISPIALISSLNFPKTNYFYWTNNEKDLEGLSEIKVSFKTFVDSVEYPFVKSERDLKIEELEQSIKEAQERLNELKEIK